MNDLIRPALYGSHHQLWPVNAEMKKRPSMWSARSVSLPTSLQRTGKLRSSTPAELLAVMSAGAYGFSLSSNYANFDDPRAAEVLSREWETYRMIRRRESYEDLVRLEETGQLD